MAGLMGDYTDYVIIFCPKCGGEKVDITSELLNPDARERRSMDVLGKPEAIVQIVKPNRRYTAVCQKCKYTITFIR